MDNPLPNTQQDLKIYQAAQYDAERVKAIRELMADEALKFLRYAIGLPTDVASSHNHMELYMGFQQSKTTVTKP